MHGGKTFANARRQHLQTERPSEKAALMSLCSWASSLWAVIKYITILLYDILSWQPEQTKTHSLPCPYANAQTPEHGQEGRAFLTLTFISCISWCHHSFSFCPPEIVHVSSMCFLPLSIRQAGNLLNVCFLCQCTDFMRGGIPSISTTTISSP